MSVREGHFEVDYADQLISNLVMRSSMAHPNLLADSEMMSS